jgi:glycosyltransferase involved in cell wall biosynthesis
VFAARLATPRSTWLVADWLEVWPLRTWRRYSGMLVGGIAWALQTVGLRRSDEVTVNSAFTLTRTRRRLRRNTGVVLGLVDLVGEQPADTVLQHHTGPVVQPGLILFAGRHISDKRLPSLPAALVVARRAHPDAHLVVTGSGTETAALREAAAVHGVAVDIKGQVSAQELERLMTEAAVLVNPSRREGFGLVVAEAAAHGTPSVVVAGDDNAAAWLVNDGVNGYVAASTEADALGAALVRALDGGEELRASTRDWFSAARRTQNLDASLDELLRRYGAFRAR